MSIIPTIARPTIAPNVNQELTVGASMSIPTGQVSYSRDAAIRLYWSDHNGIGLISNAGTVWIYNPTLNVAAAFAGFYIDRFVNSGTIGAEADNGNAFAVAVSSLASALNNSGTIFAYSRIYQAVAISHYGGDSLVVTNSGLIAAQNAPGADRTVAAAVSISMVNGGTLFNLAGGSILAEGQNAVAVSLGRGAIFPTGPQVINDGRIEAASLDPAVESVGVRTHHLGVEQMWILNNGVIRADVAVMDGSSTWPYSPADTWLTNSAAGLIDGDIRFTLGDDRVTNAGTITGNVSLGNGNDVFDNLAGTLDGTADLGWGDDRFDGGAGTDRVTGGRNADLLNGGGGADLLLGGTGDDTLIGGSGNDALYGETGNDRIVTLGGDRVVAGDGDDRIELGDLSFALIDGGGGTDRLVLPDLPNPFDLGSLFRTGRATGIEVIELASGDSAALDLADLASLPAVLRIEGAPGNALALTGGWAAAGTATIDGQLFNIFTSGGKFVQVLAAITVGTVPIAGLAGLDAVAGGPAAPALAGSGLALADPVQQNISFTLTEDLTISRDEVWTNSLGSPSGNAVIFSWVQVRLTNFGTIQASTSQNQTWALRIENVERVTNHGVISATATNGAYANALSIGAWGSAENTGTIIANGEGGALALSAHALGLTPDGGQNTFGVMSNSGSISAFSSGGSAQGAELSGSGDARLALNTGSIEASGATQTRAVSLNGWVDFVNRGMVTASSASGDPLQSIAISAYGSFNTVRNEGQINAQTALLVYDSDPFGTGLRFENAAGGQVTGNLRFAARDDTLVNAGTIAGSAYLGAGSDTYDGRGGSVSGTVFGELDDDLFYVGLGYQTFDGGGGIDHVSFAGASSGGAIDLRLVTAQNFGLGVTVVLANFEQITGSAHNDTLTGNDLANLIDGGAGIDLLAGGLGDDRIEGGNGNDTAVFAGNRADYQITTELIGGLVYTRIQGLGAFAGQGTDTLTNVEYARFADQTVAVQVSLNNRPGLGQPVMADQTILDGQPYSYQIPATSFIELDPGDVLAFRATLADGSPLPAWLSFDSATRTFSGIPPVGAIGAVLTVRVFATDNSPYDPGYEISDDFVLTINQAPGADIFGTAGNDQLFGTFRNELLAGLEGDDILTGSAGNDVLNGGAGNDSVDYSAASGSITLSLVAATASGSNIGVDQIDSIEAVIGSAHDDDLTGNTGNETLRGNLGNDTLHGLTGSDALFGEAGGDTLFGDGDADMLSGGTGADFLYGGSGNDALWSDNPSLPLIPGQQPYYWINPALDRGTEADLLDGGDGDDSLFAGFGDTVTGGSNSSSGDTLYISFMGASMGVTADFRLASLTIGGATISGIENLAMVEGSDFDDDLTARAITPAYLGYTTMYGMGGNDRLVANTRTTVIDGGDGNDTIDARGSLTLQTVSGGAGNDRLIFNAAGSGGNASGGTGTDTLVIDNTNTASFTGLSGFEALELVNSQFAISSAEFASAFAFNSTVTGTGRLIVGINPGGSFIASQMSSASTIAVTVIGSDSSDVVKGPVGAAMLVSGEGGGDQIRTGNMADTIQGGDGNDKIMAMGGADTLLGGAGGDQFRYLFATDSALGAGADRILDFAGGEDKLDFRLLDADPLSAGRQALNFIGSAAFAVNGTAQVRYADSGADTLVQIDLNGDGSADMEIVLAGHAGQPLAGTDFLL